MEVKAQDIVDSLDLNVSEALLPIYESIVNSIISLEKRQDRVEKKIEVFIERQKIRNKQTDLFDKKPSPIKNVTIVDNGIGFTEENYNSFAQPFSKINKKYGCKGIGRFTILAMFEKMEIVSTYKEGDTWYKRTFVFDAEHEIHESEKTELSGNHALQTKVRLIGCRNKRLLPYTAKNAEEIARGITDHCFIYYLSGTLPQIYVSESSTETEQKSLLVSDFFKSESKEKEKEFEIQNEKFKLFIVKSNQVTNRKYNYVTLCANSRKVGGKKELAKIDSLYLYPINENGEAKYLDIYVVSKYLDKHVNNQRTGFNIPESNEGTFLPPEEQTISIEEILRKVASEVSVLYESFAKQTKARNIKETIEFIKTKAPQYRSFLYRNDILDAMPPNLSEEKKDEYLHKAAYQENKKIEEKIDNFITSKETTEEGLIDIIDSIKKRTAYNTDTLSEYVFRRKAILRLFEKMLDKRKDGKYELESMIHNLIFPMGLTNRELVYQYHNLWLLDDRFSSFRFIASDKSIASYSQIQSSKEPDLILINDDKNLTNNPISFGNKDEGNVSSMVIFEFKRPGDTAHQKKKGDYRWDFSELVKGYFDVFLYGKEKEKKNYRGNVVKIDKDTPKFGYIIMDEMPEPLINFNTDNGWSRTPFNSYYRIYEKLNLYLEAMTFQDMLNNARERNNPFFDHLFAHNNPSY